MTKEKPQIPGEKEAAAQIDSFGALRNPIRYQIGKQGGSRAAGEYCNEVILSDIEFRYLRHLIWEIFTKELTEEKFLTLLEEAESRFEKLLSQVGIWEENNAKIYGEGHMTTNEYFTLQKKMDVIKKNVTIINEMINIWSQILRAHVHLLLSFA